MHPNTFNRGCFLKLPVRECAKQRLKVVALVLRAFRVWCLVFSEPETVEPRCLSSGTLEVVS